MAGPDETSIKPEFPEDAVPDSKKMLVVTASGGVVSTRSVPEKLDRLPTARPLDVTCATRFPPGRS